MKKLFLTAIAAATLAAGVTTASADTYLGSYVARVGENDHYASDGYLLDTAAQMVRQDRANWHKFGVYDAEDENDSWFGATDSRAWLERALNRNSAMNNATRKAIVNGYPLVQVDVYQNSVKVTIIGY
jgi:hypothetical protein